MRLLVLRKINSDQIAFTAVQGVGQRIRGFGFAHTGWPHQQEHADRLLRIGQAAAIGTQPLGDGLQRRLLPHHPLAHPFNQRTQGVGFVGEHLPKRNARPAADHRRHSGGIDTIRHQRHFIAQLGGGGFQLADQRRTLHQLLLQFLVIVQPRTEIQHPLAGGQQLADPLALVLPASFHFPRLKLEFFRLHLQFTQSVVMIDADQQLAIQTFTLFFDRRLLLTNFFQRGRHIMLRQRHSCTGSIKHADGFVRQLTPGNVTLGQAHSLANRGIQNLYPMVRFQLIGHRSQHDHRAILVRLFDLDTLKTSVQRRIFLEIFFVLLPGGGGDGAQFPTCQRRFQQVGGVAAALGAARAYQRVGFVDK